MRAVTEFLLNPLGAEMKKMIKMVAMLAVMFVAVSTVAKAQDAQQQGRGNGRGGGRGVTALIGNLGLDSATTAKITDIATKYGAETRKMMQDAQAAGGQADMAKVAEVNKKRNDEIKALLNDDQKKKFDENVANAPQGRGRPPFQF